MFGIWRYLWKSTPSATGFHGPGEKKHVVRRCKRWARVVTKYKQVMVQTDQGPDVRRIPDEWDWRCLEWEYITIALPERHGTRVPTEIRQPEPMPLDPGKGHGKSKHVFRSKDEQAVVPRFVKQKFIEATRRKKPK